jgi:transcriptional regulator with XRE-family HTH domain
MIPRAVIIRSRNALGLTQSQLATELGISRSHLANIEREHDRLGTDAETKLAAVIERAGTITRHVSHGGV